MTHNGTQSCLFSGHVNPLFKRSEDNPSCFTRQNNYRIIGVFWKPFQAFERHFERHFERGQGPGDENQDPFQTLASNVTCGYGRSIL